MLTKTSYKGGKTCRVTFTWPKEDGVGRVSVVGDFNEWSEKVNPLVRRKKGHFSASLTLETGRTYAFRYLLDGKRWENDPDADGARPNPFGTRDSLLSL